MVLKQITSVLFFGCLVGILNGADIQFESDKLDQMDKQLDEYPLAEYSNKSNLENENYNFLSRAIRATKRCAIRKHLRHSTIHCKTTTIKMQCKQTCHKDYTLAKERNSRQIICCHKQGYWKSHGRRIPKDSMDCIQKQYELDASCMHFRHCHGGGGHRHCVSCCHRRHRHDGGRHRQCVRCCPGHHGYGSHGHYRFGSHGRYRVGSHGHYRFGMKYRLGAICMRFLHCHGGGGHRHCASCCHKHHRIGGGIHRQCVRCCTGHHVYGSHGHHRYGWNRHHGYGEGGYRYHRRCRPRHYRGRKAIANSPKIETGTCSFRVVGGTKNCHYPKKEEAAKYPKDVTRLCEISCGSSQHKRYTCYGYGEWDPKLPYCAEPAILISYKEHPDS